MAHEGVTSEVLVERIDRILRRAEALLADIDRTELKPQQAAKLGRVEAALNAFRA